jgi:hypothetical protein
MSKTFTKDEIDFCCKKCTGPKETKPVFQAPPPTVMAEPEPTTSSTLITTASTMVSSPNNNGGITVPYNNAPTTTILGASQVDTNSTTTENSLVAAFTNMSDSFKCNCETVDYCALKENKYKSSNAKTGDLMYYRESTSSNENALLEYDYLNLENTLAEKTPEEAEQDRINEISRRRVLENDEGLQFLYDPVTNSLISFKETRDVYNNIQKLENKMDLIDQQLLAESSVDFTSNRIVRNKLLYPALAVNAEELAEETVEEVEETVEEVEETVEEVVKDTVKPEKKKKNSLGTIVLIVFLILLVIALISLLIYKKSVYM